MPHTHTPVRGIRDALLNMEMAAVNAVMQGHSMVTTQLWIGCVYVHLTMCGIKQAAWTYGVIVPGQYLTTSFDVYQVENDICLLLNVTEAA